MISNNSFVLGFRDIEKATPIAIGVRLVGGKGANLGELTKIEGLHVPDGFCISTAAYKDVLANNAELNALLDQLIILKADNRKAISEISGKIRRLIEEIAIPKNIENEISQHLKQLGEEDAYAVRSSATAEDLPTASFAGQQDTYLNIVGKENILKHIIINRLVI